MTEALAALGAGELVARRSDATLIAAVLRLAGGREVLLVERTYRFGVRLIADPSPAEIGVVEAGDLRALWRSERSERLSFVV